ncbi:Uncharacterised protein [Chlamydia trachomatis]|nr:Uncharacterised protein [Chlamydia trachomatis]
MRWDSGISKQVDIMLNLSIKGLFRPDSQADTAVGATFNTFAKSSCVIFLSFLNILIRSPMCIFLHLLLEYTL